MPERRKPPHRRGGINFRFTYDRQEYRATLNVDDEGRPIEVFVEYGKDAATTMGILARDAGILISIALQHGADLRTLRDAMSRDEETDQFGNPRHPATFSPAVGQAQSIIGAALDAACAELESAKGSVDG